MLFIFFLFIMIVVFFFHVFSFFGGRRNIVTLSRNIYLSGSRSSGRILGAAADGEVSRAEVSRAEVSHAACSRQRPAKLRRCHDDHRRSMLLLTGWTFWNYITNCWCCTRADTVCAQYVVSLSFTSALPSCCLLNV